ASMFALANESAAAPQRATSERGAQPDVVVRDWNSLPIARRGGPPLLQDQLLLLLVARVTVEGTRGSKLAVFMANHVFCNENGHELATVMYSKGQTNCFRADGRTARPGLDDLLGLFSHCLFDFAHEMTVNKRSLR